MNLIENQITDPLGDASVPLDATGGRRTPMRARVAPSLSQLLRHREFRRAVAFLFAGGVSAAVTLATTSILFEWGGYSFFWSAVAGTELGILVNFTLNDRLAFQDLSGHQRPLLIRVLRYHVTCAAGQSLILLLSLLLHSIAHWWPVFAQALPIVLVTAVNFTMHRLWTYHGGGKPEA